MTLKRTNMIKSLTITTLLTIIAFTSFGQSMAEENIVLFAKANLLYESARYDEAVRMYNRVLANDEEHTAAILMRAKTKYALGAYLGTKKDGLLFIEKAGVTKELIKVMAHTEAKLENEKAAFNYVRTALELDPYDAAMHLLHGDLALVSDAMNDACESFDRAAQLGSSKANSRMNKYCGSRSNSRQPQRNDLPSKPTQPDRDDSQTNDTNNNDRNDGEVISLDDIVNDTNRNNGGINGNERGDNTDYGASQNVVISDQLTIEITDGIGNRKVDYKPSIFMLSDQGGNVVIDVCIDSRGNVSEANFNRDRSTIFRSSITSLALRKAKDFKFDSSQAREQCGVMVFKIKA